jgi:hypothetical protein
MESFPTIFVATKVSTDVIQNRHKKIEQDMKILRQKIVNSFQGRTQYHTKIKHQLLPDLNESEQREYYKIIKKELEERGFTVRGEISNGIISLIIFSHAPRTNEMEKILKQYTRITRPLKEKSSSFQSNHEKDSPPLKSNKELTSDDINMDFIKKKLQQLSKKGKG